MSYATVEYFTKKTLINGHYMLGQILVALGLEETDEQNLGKSTDSITSVIDSETFKIVGKIIQKDGYMLIERVP